MVFNDEGRPVEALAVVEKALRLNQRNPFIPFELLRAYRRLGRWQEGLAALKSYVALHPDDLEGHLGLCIADVELGRAQDARLQAAEVMRLNPQFKVRNPEETPLSTDARHFDADLRMAGLQ
jgi:tetratricopeptide (TPR) repeat protein